MLEIFNYPRNHQMFWNKIGTEQKILATELVVLTTIGLRSLIGAYAKKYPTMPIFNTYSVGELTAMAAVYTAIFYMNIGGWIASKYAKTES